MNFKYNPKKMKPKKLFLNHSSNDTSVRTVCRPPSAVHRLAAFTMLELITVLALSTIVIGTAYTAYEIIYKDFLDYKNTNTEALQAMDFVTTLERDITNADSLHIYQDEWVLYQKNQKVNYLFGEEIVIKSINEDFIFSFDINTEKDNSWQYLIEQTLTKKVIFE